MHHRTCSCRSRLDIDTLLEGAFELEAGTDASHPTLRRGSTGDAVRELQRLLTAAGFPLVADGDFGSLTEGAVRAFQASRGLAADGVAGKQTWNALSGDSAPGYGTPPPRGGASPEPGPGRPPSESALVPGSPAERIVAEARRHIGFHEGPNNDNPFSAYFGAPNVAWCTYFVSYVYTKAGFPVRQGSSSGMLSDITRNGTLSTAVPSPGDVVIFDWTQGDNDPANHAGIVESVTRGADGTITIQTIEGNASDQVKRSRRTYGDVRIVGFGRFYNLPRR